MFRLLGFPVHVRGGFVMFMVLIVVLYGGEFGLWLAGSLAVFTLIHELGHAVAARAAGAEAEISLNFLAGYASYRPTRPISRLEHAGISFAGPAVQIVTSLAVLLVMGVNPLVRESIDDSPASWAIWWAGPVIGLLNLIPVLPLDGGNIVQSALDRIVGDRSHRLMLWFSLSMTGVFAVLCFTSDRARGLFVFVGFLLVTQLQMLGGTKKPTSPWDDANAALLAGKDGKARRILMATLSTPRPDASAVATTVSAADMTALIDLLPDPLPFGDPLNEYVLANQLIRIGRFEDAAHYAAESFRRNPHTLSAATVARAAAALGDQTTAVGWLRAAADTGTTPTGLATIIDQSPELAGLRHHPEVTAIRHSLMLPPIPAS
jgi:Zn-dependent protease